MKMRKLIISLSVIIMLALSINVLGAEKTFQDVILENQEMRKNVTWMAEGIYLLNKNGDKRLAITKEQAGRILPLYQGLIEKKIILIEMKSNDPGSPGPRILFRNPNGTGNPGASNSPEQRSERSQQQMAELVALTEFGKQQLGLIDNIFTKEQVKFIDNLDFKPEKYGYMDLTRLSGVIQKRPNQQGSESQDQFNSVPRRNGRLMEKVRKKREESQKLLIKLNQDVLNILTTISKEK